MWFSKFLLFLPSAAVGLYALAPGLLNLWLLWFANSRSIEVTQSQIIFSFNGLAMSLLPAGLIFVPVARRWFLARRDNWPAEAFFWQLRLVFIAYVLYRFDAKFRNIPLPQELSIFTDATTLFGVGLVFVMTTVLPGDYSRELARNMSDKAKQGANVIGTESQTSLIGTRPISTSFSINEPSKLGNDPSERFRARSAEIMSHQSHVKHNPGAVQFERRTLEGTRQRKETRIGLEWPVYIFTIPFLILCASAVYGLRSAQFLPDASLVSQFYSYRYILTAAVFFIVLIASPWFFPPEKARVFRSSPVLHATYAAVLFAAFFHVTAPMALLKGLPSFHAVLGAEQSPGIAQVTIVERGKHPRNRGCNYSAMVVGEEYAGVIPLKVCEIDPTDWEKVTTGDTIVLYGGRTSFGFRYQRAQLNRKN